MERAGGAGVMVVVVVLVPLEEISNSNCVSNAHSSPRMVSSSTSPESVEKGRLG